MDKKKEISNLFDRLARDIASETGNPADQSLRDLNHVWEKAGSYKQGVRFDASNAFEKFKAEHINPTQAPTVKQPARQFTLSRYVIGMAATMLILAGAWLQFKNNDVNIQNNQALPIAYVLEDGSYLHVFPETSVAIDESYGESQRLVTLSEGKTLIDVKKSSVPFMYRVGDSYIEVTGTQFSVDYTNDKVSIDLFEGSINYVSNGKKHKLSAGESLYHDLATGEITIGDSVDKSVLDIASGALYFQNTPLNDVFERLAQFYDVDFTFNKTVPSELHFTSTRLEDQPIENILQTLEVSFDLAIDATSDSNYKVKFNK